jgi:hypothetical protein
MATLAPLFNVQFFTNEGVPAASYQLDTFESGTTTPKQTFTNQAGTTPNTNPIILDSDGRCSLWLGSGEYTFRLRTSVAMGGATVKTWDDVAGVSDGTTGSFLPLAGGVTMTGRFNLAGAAVSGLQPPTLTQVNELIATATGTLASDAELAAVAADVTAAEADITALETATTTLKGVPANTTSGGVDGEATNVTASFNLDVSTWPAGRVRAWQNTTSSTVVITSTGGTLRLNGTTSTGNRTIAPYGFVTVRAYATGVAVISGAVS